MKPERAQQQLADAIAALERAETRLRRAFTKWSGARQRVKRLERALDAAFEAAATPREPAPGDPDDSEELAGRCYHPTDDGTPCGACAACIRATHFVSARARVGLLGDRADAAIMAAGVACSAPRGVHLADLAWLGSDATVHERMGYALMLGRPRRRSGAA